MSGMQQQAQRVAISRCDKTGVALKATHSGEILTTAHQILDPEKDRDGRTETGT